MTSPNSLIRMKVSRTYNRTCGRFFVSDNESYHFTFLNNQTHTDTIYLFYICNNIHLKNPLQWNIITRVDEAF